MTLWRTVKEEVEEERKVSCHLFLHLFLLHSPQRLLPSAFKWLNRLIKRSGTWLGPVATGKNDRLKPGKLLDQIEHIGNETRQFSVLMLDIQGAIFFKRYGLFLFTRYISANTDRSFWNTRHTCYYLEYLRSEIRI